jgi:hypothetical protein
MAKKPLKGWATKFQHVLDGEITYGVYAGRSKETVKELLKDSRPGSTLVRVEIKELR